jgi:DNA mismatch repair protein MutL
MSEQPSTTIKILPESLSTRIAAGEVVERPAAVVKELIDNSLDAMSQMITVEVEEGGRGLIRVTDDGEGMTRENAQLACHRFATSKLRSEQDLHNIRTLGFRGEALPSIASISRFSLRTMRREELVGTATSSEGGDSWSLSDYSGAPGTQVEVKDLFFNTPARKKFLKSIATEFSKICHVVQQAAMAWPAVHFRLVHNGHSVFDLPSVSAPQDRVLQIYGDRFMHKVLQVDHERSGLRVEGYTVSPYHTGTSRTPQEIFVNRRPVKNTTIAHATYQAYGSFLPKGQHPIFALFIDLDPAIVDVNVHPAKREVRFSHPEFIHSTVKEAVRLSLHETLQRPIMAPSAERPEQGREQWTPEPTAAPPSRETQHLLYSPESHAGTAASQISREPAPAFSLIDQELEVYPLGQVNRTFLIGQVNGELQIVDQHTAHERVLFERLWRAWQAHTLQTQPLLIPETVDLPPHQCELLVEHLPELAQLGLEIEQFGQHVFVVRSVPAMLGALSVTHLIHQLIEDLSEWHSADSLEAKIRPIFASMACQTAVQAGRPMTSPEIQELLTDWAREGYPMTCPHGRRVAFRLTLDELNKMFGRA